MGGVRAAVVLGEIGLWRLMDKRKQLSILKLQRSLWSLTLNQAHSSRSERFGGTSQSHQADPPP